MKRHTNSAGADIWLYRDLFLCLHEEYHIDLRKTFIVGPNILQYDSVYRLQQRQLM